jgi:cyclopropane fatty-acyl-phospholipid synthase-like methyltransferase
MAEQNAYRVADWNGQSGERWVANQARLDAMAAVFGLAAIEAAAPATGERVLDIGCGAGASSLLWPPASARGAKCWAWTYPNR